MRLKDKIVDISRWDSYSFVIFSVTVIFQIFKWGIFPIFIDIYYHLLTTLGFSEAGGWLGRCFWEFAPVGRPQLYPPLLHIIMLFFLKIGMPILLIGKIVQFIIYPLLLFVIWYVIREIFDKGLAFFSLFLLFSIYSFYLITINTLAASISLVFCLLSLLFLERNKVLTSALLFSLAFYTHSFTPWLFLGVFILYGVLLKEKFKVCLKICLLALLLSCPILIYQIGMHKFYVFQRNLGENYYMEINLLHGIIFLFGFVTCFQKQGKYYIFVSLFLISIVLLFFGFIFRYLSFYGIMSMVFIDAVFLSKIYDNLGRKNKKIYLAIIFILFFVLSPTLTLDMFKENKRGDIFGAYHRIDSSLIFRRGIFTLNLFDSSLANLTFYCSRFIRTNELSIYFPRIFQEVVDVIMNNSSDKDIIWSNLPYSGGVISLLSQRATSDGMLQEVRPYNVFDKILVSKLIIWQKDPDDMKQEPVQLIEKYQLKKIKDTKLAFIYENPKCIFKKQTLTAAISYKILFMLIFLIFALIVCSANSD